MGMTTGVTTLTTEERIKIAVRRFLRWERLVDAEGNRPLMDHVPSNCRTENIGDTSCRDERQLIEDLLHTADLQGRNPLLNPLYGGGKRFSKRCGVPIDWYRREIAPLYRPGVQFSDEEILAWDREELETAIRAIIKGIVVRGSRLYKVGIHGPNCGWARLLNYGLIHQLWLVIDGCNTLEQMARDNGWGPFQVYATYHEHFPLEDGTQSHHTYAIRRKHALFSKYTLDEILSMTDREFLRREAGEFLRLEDPELLDELRHP